MSIDYSGMKKKLENEYLEVFEKAEMYGMLKNMNEDMLSEMMMNLLDVLLAAQKDEKPIENVIGKDVEKFCRSYFSTYTFRSHLREIPRTIAKLMVGVFLLLLMEVGAGAGESGFDLFTYKTDVGAFILGFVGGGIILFLMWVFIRPLVFRFKHFPMWLFYTVFFASLVGMVVLLVTFEDRWQLQVPCFMTILISGGYLLTYVIVRSVWRYRNTGAIRKQKDFEPKHKSAFAQGCLDGRTEAIHKRYEKLNKKRARKGLEPMAPEEYMVYVRKQNKKSMWGNRSCAVLVTLIVLGTIVREGMANGWLEALIFAGVLLIFEIPAIFIFYTAIRGAKEIEQCLDECEKEGITILEYEQD